MKVAPLVESIDEHIQLFQRIRSSLLGEVVACAETLYRALSDGHKILAAGNGGSAADAQHFIAELIGRFMRERRALAGIALTTDTSILTAVGNDYGFEQVFSRQVEGLGLAGDVFVGISTSGNSENILRAMRSAKEIGLKTIALVGKSGGSMMALADEALLIPCSNTPRIQEAHEWVLHTWCDLIDRWRD